MLPDRVSNPGPLTYESSALPIALHGPAQHRLCATWEGSQKAMHSFLSIMVWCIGLEVKLANWNQTCHENR